MPRDLVRLGLLGTLVLSVALGGCLSGDDDDNTPPTEPPPYELPDTMDHLMAVFDASYCDRDLEHYGMILHEDFRFIAQDQTEYDREEELAISERMFHEIAGEGGIVFSAIEITEFTARGPWDATPAEDPEFGDAQGSFVRPYDLEIRFQVANENLWYVVQGLVVFYAQETDGRFQLLGMQDRTEGGKATEAHSWSGVKALFY